MTFTNLKHLSKQLIIYFLAGGLMTLAEWLGFWVLVYLCGVHYLVANALLFVVFVPLGMLIFKKAVFKRTALKVRTELALSFAINLFGLAINSLILWLLVEFAALKAYSPKSSPHF